MFNLYKCLIHYIIELFVISEITSNYSLINISLLFIYDGYLKMGWMQLITSTQITVFK